VHHFTLLNFAVFVIGSLLGLWLAVMGKETAGKSAADVAPHLVGLCFLELLGYAIVTILLPIYQKAPAQIVPTMVGNLQNAVENLIDAGVVKIIIYFGILIALYVVQSKSYVGFYAKWLMSSVIFGAILLGITESLNAPAILAIILYSMEICNHLSTNCKKMRRWKTWLCILLLAVVLLSPGTFSEFSQRGYAEYLFFEKIFTGGTLFLMFALGMVCLIAFQIILSSGTRYWFPDNDIKLMLIVVCSIPFVAVLHEFYTPAWPVFVILFSVSTLWMIGLRNKERATAVNRYYAEGYLPVATVALVSANIAFCYGRGVGMVSFIIGLIVFLHGLFDLRNLKKRADEDHTLWGTSKIDTKWQKDAIRYVFALLWIAVVAACFVWYNCRSMSSFLILAAILVICVILVEILSYEPIIFLKKRVNPSMAVVAVFCLACVLLTHSAGTKFNIDTDAGSATVKATARGESNQVVSTEETWLEFDWIDCLRNGEKVSLAAHNRRSNPTATARYTVTTEDRYGITSTATRWVHVCDYEA
jgi:hypothetical protein